MHAYEDKINNLCRNKNVRRQRVALPNASTRVEEICRSLVSENANRSSAIHFIMSFMI